jgi:hypothetical protein
MEVKRAMNKKVEYIIKYLKVYHPFLFSLYPILFLYSINFGQVNLMMLSLPLLLSLGLAISIMVILCLIFKSPEKAGLITTVVLILFFFYGHIYGLLHSHFPIIGRHRYLMLCWVGIFVASIYYTATKHTITRMTTTFLNSSAIFLTLYQIVTIGINEYNSYRSADNVIFTDNLLTQEYIDNSKSTIHRDIYYIILDGYASDKTLSSIYNYDNSVFYDYLEDKGFFIANNSNSNFPGATFLSLASSLNFEYHNYLVEEIGDDSIDRSILYQMVKNNRIINILQPLGYRSINFSSGWGPTDYNEYADINFFPESVANEFYSVLLKTTALRIYSDIISSDLWRERILYTFNNLAKVNEIDGPKFIFAHINSPHPPFVFDQHGEPVPQSKFSLNGSVWLQKDNYINQLTFISHKIELLINEILSKSDTPPIIILQSDHGPASEMSLSLDPFSIDDIMERTGILNAYYLPEGGDKQLYDTISPVNSFRIIFNHYFGMNLDLLMDKSYYSTYEYPYKYIDVTNIVN